MRIGMDITPILYRRGVSRYTLNLAKALLELEGVDMSLYGSSLRQFNNLENIAEDILEDYPQSSYKVHPYPPSLLKWIWRFGLNKIEPHLPGIDVFHSWDWLQPPDNHFPYVSTVHDLAILRFPETSIDKVIKMHRRSWLTLAERQAHIIAVSRSTKRDLIERIGLPSYLIHVVYEALPREFRYVSSHLSEEKYDEIKTRLGLDKPYIFFVGTREPRKNLLNLIEAWEPLAKDVGLLIAGEKGWDGTEKFNTQTLQDKGLRFLGKVTDEELVVLYAEAQVFAYPSLYEGFGLPILEAFHEGTPVVTSNNSGMLEVAGNAAELVNPYHPESIREGLTKVLSEDSKAQQQRLQRMIIRLQMFSWRKVARETMAVYEQAVKDAYV